MASFIALAPATAQASPSHAPGAPLVEGGGTATGTLTSGSNVVTAITAANGSSFAVGQIIRAGTSNGIPAGTTITAVGAGSPPATLTLSAAATENASNTPLAAGLNQPCGIATDTFGDVYVANQGLSNASKITIYRPNGTTVTEFSPGFALCSISVDESGDIYGLIAGAGSVAKWVPTVSPPFASVPSYGNASLPLISGRATAIDPSTQNLYISQAAAGEQQKITFSGTWVDNVDTFTLGNLPSGCGPPPTITIAWRSTTSNRNNSIKAALEESCGAGNIGVGSVGTGEIPPPPVPFKGKSLDQDVPLMTAAVPRPARLQPRVKRSPAASPRIRPLAPSSPQPSVK